MTDKEQQERVDRLSVASTETWNKATEAERKQRLSGIRQGQ